MNKVLAESETTIVCARSARKPTVEGIRHAAVALIDVKSRKDVSKYLRRWAFALPESMGYGCDHGLVGEFENAQGFNVEEVLEDARAVRWIAELQMLAVAQMRFADLLVADGMGSWEHIVPKLQRGHFEERFDFVKGWRWRCKPPRNIRRHLGNLTQYPEQDPVPKFVFSYDHSSSELSIIQPRRFHEETEKKCGFTVEYEHALWSVAHMLLVVVCEQVMRKRYQWSYDCMVGGYLEEDDDLIYSSGEVLREFVQALADRRVKPCAWCGSPVGQTSNRRRSFCTNAHAVRYNEQAKKDLRRCGKPEEVARKYPLISAETIEGWHETPGFYE